MFSVLLLLLACGGKVRGLDSDATAPAQLDFGEVAPGQRKALALLVDNTGVVQLSLPEAQVAAPFSVDSLPGTVEAGAGASLQLAFAPQAAGTFSQTLKISTSSTKTPFLNVQLTGTAPAPLPAGLAVAPQQLSIDVHLPAAPAAQALALTNTGDAALSWTSASDGPELTLSATSGQLAARQAVPLLVSLAPAADHADVTRHLTFSAAGSPAVIVPVQIHYFSNGAALEVSPLQLALSAQFPAAPPPAQLQIRNVGHGPITWSLTPGAALAVEPGSGSIAEGAAAATVTVSLKTPLPATPVSFTQEIRVSTQEAGEQRVQVTVTLSPPLPPPQYGASVWPKFHQGNSLTGLSSVFTHTTGHVRWKVPFGPARQTAVQGTYVGSPTLGADGTIYQVGGDSSAGTLRAFEPEHGNPRWIADITPPASEYAASIEATPTVVSSGAIFVMTGSEANGVNHFYKVAADGHTTTLPHDAPSPNDWYSDGFDSSPALGADGTIYTAFDEDPGIILWSQGDAATLPAELGRVSIASSRSYASDIETQSAAISNDGTAYWSTNGQLYVTSKTALLWSWDATGHGNATTNMTSRQAPTLTPDGHVIFAWSKSELANSGGNVTTTVTCLTAGQQKGVKVWETALPAALPVVTIGPSSGATCSRSGLCFTERLSLSSPAQGPDGTLYVGHMNGLYALDPLNGSVKFHVPGATVASSPAVGADGTVFYGAMDGKLTAVSPQGQVLWQVSTGGQVNSSPAIGADGTVFVASDDGLLYAVE